MNKPWRIVYEASVKRTLETLIKNNQISEDDFDIVLKWIEQVEKYGPASLRKTKRLDDFHPLRITEEILNRQESEKNLWNDHDLKGQWIGYRSSSFSKLGRIIYKVENHMLRIVCVEKITSSHDYRR